MQAMLSFINEALLGGGGGGLYVPRLNFKPFSEGAHVAVGISSIATDEVISEMFNYRMFNANTFS